MEGSERKLDMVSAGKEWPTDQFNTNEFAMMVSPQEDGTLTIEIRCVSHDMVKEIFTPEVAEGVHMMALDSQISWDDP